MNSQEKKQLVILGKTALFMAIGIVLLKVLPMSLFGVDILFDASFHITITMFGLYILWFFIDHNKKAWTPFFVFAVIVLAIVALQRIETNAHNDIGLLLGFLISTVSIYIANPKLFKHTFDF